MQQLKTATTALVLMLGLGLPAVASSQLDPGLKDKIAAELVANGYDVRKFDYEDGMIEVYAVRDGKMYEIYLDEAGKIVATKQKG